MPHQTTKTKCTKVTTHFPRGWTQAKGVGDNGEPATWRCTCGETGTAVNISVEEFLRVHGKAGQ